MKGQIKTDSKKLVSIEEEEKASQQILGILKENNFTFENFENLIPKIKLFFKKNATI